MTAKKAKKSFRTTRDAAEVAQFDSLGQRWWDEDGPMRPLHRLNPIRMKYLKDQICSHTGRDENGIGALKGISVADIGCGGGLVAEPFARMGAQVTGIDAGAENIAVASAHARQSGLDIEYIAATAEEVAAKGRTFDVVTALEIIEHVADVDLFVEACAELVKPGGMIVFSTLNRTAKSYLLGIVGVEYVLRWLPRGTHDWRKFMKPSEIAVRLEQHEFKVTDVRGLVFRPLSGDFALSRTDLDVNYFLTAVRK